LWENPFLIATLGIVDSALIAGFFLTLYYYLKPASPERKRENGEDHCGMCLAILVAVLVLMLVMLIYILARVNALYLPFAVVFAIAATVITLTIAATIFKELNLTSDREALGLPKGTIRAIIALSLIVIFAIMIIFTQYQLRPTWEEFPFNANVVYPNGTIVNYPNGTAILKQPSEAQKDFSLQTLTTISTLVVAIVGFYFGTRAVEVARGVEPALSLEITPESPTELNLTKNREVDPIRAATTPANLSVDFRIDKTDGEIIRKSKANEFSYKPSEELVKEVKETGKEKEVTLSFWLTKERKTSKSLRVKIKSGMQTPPT
jgi:hypothetical protein